MNDQGDKIIHLAREVLRSGRLAEGYDADGLSHCESKTISIKAAALAALLAAFGSASLTHLIEDARRPITRYERVEIDALLFYASQQNAIDEESLKSETLSALALHSLQDMSAFDYRQVRDYLRDRIR